MVTSQPFTVRIVAYAWISTSTTEEVHKIVTLYLWSKLSSVKILTISKIVLKSVWSRLTVIYQSLHISPGLFVERGRVQTRVCVCVRRRRLCALV